MNNARISAFTVNYDGNTKVLNTVIAVSSSFKNEKTSNVQCRAIWDTGATKSAISSKVAKSCKLVPIGKVQVYTANGPTDQNVYLVDVMLPNNIVVHSVLVTEIEEIHDADALIGMDIMSIGDMAITHKDNNTVFTFEIPSVETIDFVEKINRINEKEQAKARLKEERLLAKIGNQKCPCGSGKKYRYCCGKKNKELQTQ